MLWPRAPGARCASGLTVPGLIVLWVSQCSRRTVPAAAESGSLLRLRPMRWSWSLADGGPRDPPSRKVRLSPPEALYA